MEVGENSTSSSPLSAPERSQTKVPSVCWVPTVFTVTLRATRKVALAPSTTGSASLVMTPSWSAWQGGSGPASGAEIAASAGTSVAASAPAPASASSATEPSASSATEPSVSSGVEASSPAGCAASGAGTPVSGQSMGRSASG